MKRDSFVGSFFILSTLIILGITCLSRASLPITKVTGITIRGITFLLGMVTFFWVLVYIKEVIQGTVVSVTYRLITTGPFCWVRHPLHLRMIMTLLGIGVAFRSLWGIIAVLVLYLLMIIFRARLEEKAVSGKVGRAWGDYVSRTNF